METRSMTKNKTNSNSNAILELYDGGPYEVNIDLDDASRCWRENKKHVGNGQFQYICGATKTNGKVCIRGRKMGFTRCAGHCKGETLDSDWLRIKGR